VIRVYDDAGKQLRRTSTLAISKSGEFFLASHLPLNSIWWIHRLKLCKKLSRTPQQVRL
jgi:hypothetical protein